MSVSAPKENADTFVVAGPDRTDEEPPAQARAGDSRLAEGDKALGPGQDGRGGRRQLEISGQNLHRGATNTAAHRPTTPRNSRSCARRPAAEDDRGRPGARQGSWLRETPDPGSTSGRRRAARGSLRVSERCRARPLVGQPCSTQRLGTAVPPDEQLAPRAFLRASPSDVPTGVGDGRPPRLARGRLGPCGCVLRPPRSLRPGRSSHRHRVAGRTEADAAQLADLARHPLADRGSQRLKGTKGHQGTKAQGSKAPRHHASGAR